MCSSTAAEQREVEAEELRQAQELPVVQILLPLKKVSRHGFRLLVSRAHILPLFGFPLLTCPVVEPLLMFCSVKLATIQKVTKNASLQRTPLSPSLKICQKHE